MKFWKPILLTAISFIGIASTTLYTSCVQDSCANLTCQNGGTCSSGLCNCPSGYEGTQCETLSQTRYLGRYYGVTTCGNGSAPGLIDTVDVIKGPNLTTLGVVEHMNITDTMYGTISASPSAYTINIPDVVNGGYKRTVTVTLLDVNKLQVYTNTVYNGTTTACNFVGTTQQ